MIEHNNPKQLLLSITSKNPCTHGESTYVTKWGVTLYKCDIKGVFNKEDKDLFIGRQEFVVGYSKAPEQR